MDILTRLQNLPPSKFHYRLLVLVGIGWLFDAMDTGLVSFILPELGKDWSLEPAQLGWIVSISFVGMALGAVISGWFADRFGRKTVFAGTMAVYSIATGLCAFAPNLSALLFFRFFVGVGLGGQLPVAVSLVSEYAPPKVRGRFIVLLESFWGLGWLAAALASYFFIPKFGWHSAFLIGALPIVYIPLVLKFIPESVPYLLSQGKTDEAHRLVSRLEEETGMTPTATAIAPPQKEKQRIRFIQLWQQPFARRTLMLWLVWFGIVFSYYGIFTWLPKLLVEQGCAWFFGQSSSAAEVMAWGSLMSFFNLGAWGVLYTYTPELYPLRFRAFASGWAGAIGRIGGILAPMVVAKMVGGSDGFGNIFMMFAGVMMLIVLVILALGEETKGRTLEDING